MKLLTKISLVLATLGCATIPAAAQDEVPRYDFYAGYAYFNSPKIGLPEHGFHIQAGVNVKRWLALGLDYSRAEGDLSLTPSLLKTSLRTAAESLIDLYKQAGLVPQDYTGAVPTSVLTQTYAAGPQLVWRRHKFALIFGPSIGYVRERATAHPSDDITDLFVQEISPDGPTSRDHRWFYGAGAGVDVHMTRHVGLRVRVDVVHDLLFTSQFLASGRNTVRVSVGPSFHFGKSLR